MIIRRLFVFCAAAYFILMVLAAGGDDLSDFYNDLVTDLAPFLSLFGESMTKQYLSESTTWCDYFILAMGPIGILTTVISVIRLCGYSWLKAFIGRSQEGTAMVEAELCTSTSRDVCELYNYGGIARVLGRPKLLELIYIPSSHCHNRGGCKEELQMFRHYLQQSPNDQDHWREKKSSRVGSWFSNISLTRPSSKEKVQRMNRDDLEASKRKCGIDKDSEAPQNDGHPATYRRGLLPASQNPPNLSLNIGIIQLRPWILHAAAVMGIILQGGVVVLAGLDAWAIGWGFDSDSSSANKDAPILFVIGTLIMCCGLIICASLIGKSTEEISYEHQKGSDARLIWLQPHQVIGDQSFDPFAFFETRKKPVKVWTCSARKREEIPLLKTSSTRDKDNSQVRKASSQHRGQDLGSKRPVAVSNRAEGFVTRASPKEAVTILERSSMAKSEVSSLLSVAAVIFGYVLQFTGLRRMKTWVSLAQLGTTLLMSMLRGMVRMRRLESDDNLLSSHYEIVVGHELDWLACEIWRSLPDESYINEPSNLWDGQSESRKFMKWWSEKSSANIEPALFLPWEDLINLTSHRQILSIRERLAHLTGNLPVSDRIGKEEFQNWDDKHVKVRAKAKGIAAAICKIADDCVSVHEKRSTEAINIKIPRIVQRDKRISHDSSDESFEISLKAPDGMSSTSYTMNAASLEAVLGLDLWSLILNDHSKFGEKATDEQVQYARVICCDPSSKLGMRLWHPDIMLAPKEAVFQFNAHEKHGLLDLWQSSSNNQEKLTWKAMKNPGSKAGRSQTEEDNPTPGEVLRLWGWTALTEHLMEANTNGTEGDMVSAELTFIQTKNSPLEVCAQELFTSLLVGLRDHLLGSYFGSTFHDADWDIIILGLWDWSFRSSLVEKLADAFVDADLGTRPEAMLCVVSALRGQFPKGHDELLVLISHSLRKLPTTLLSNTEQSVWRRLLDQVRRLDRHSVGPYLRALCHILRSEHDENDQPSRVRLSHDKFQSSVDGEYSHEIGQIVDTYRQFLSKLEIHRKTYRAATEPTLMITELISSLESKPLDEAPESTLMVTEAKSSLEPKWLDDVASRLAIIANSGVHKSVSSSKKLFSALAIAARKGLVGVLCILLNLGVDPNQILKEGSPIYISLQHGHEVCARVLINFGASIRAPLATYGPSVGQTHAPVVDILSCAILQADFDFAAERNDSVDLILKTLDIRRYELISAIELAFENPREKDNGTSVLTVLIDHGINIGISPEWVLSSLHTSCADLTPLLNAYLGLKKVISKYGHYIMLWALSDDSEYAYIAQELVQRGVQPDQPLATPYSHTALHLAVRWPATLKALISGEEIHPNIEVKNGAGHTPLCKAVCEGQYESATLLLERGASPELIGRGQRPMDCAIHNKDEQMVRLLWDHGASIKSISSRSQQRVVKATSLGEVEKLLSSWEYTNNQS